MFNQAELMKILSQVLFGMLGACLMQLFFIHHAEHVATVNITSMVDSFVKETAKQKLTPDEMKQKVTHFSEVLNILLQRSARQKHLVLVPTEAVIAGAFDITDEIQQNTHEALKI